MADIIASQFDPSCISPSPSSTTVRRGDPSSFAAIAVPDRDRQTVAERSGIGLDTGQLVAVGVAVRAGTAAP
ncbi:MAG: hypothetical protein QM804_02515 [Propionicimonas sp.]